MHRLKKSAITLFGFILTLAALQGAEPMRFSPDEMWIDFYRGGKTVAEKSAPSGKAAKVGRDWSISWFMEPKKQKLDYTIPYDVIVRCKGDFMLGMYGKQRSGFISRYRPIQLPPGEWRDVRVTREKLHYRDYLTTDGVGKEGFLGEVILVPHPVSEEERKLDALAAPGGAIDAAGKAELAFTGRMAEPVKLRLWMPRNEFCPKPSATVETTTVSGIRRSLPIEPGTDELTVPASASDPLRSLTVKADGHGKRVMLKLAILNRPSDQFGICDTKSSFANINCFDTAAVNPAMNNFLAECRYRRDRKTLFAKHTGDLLALPESAMHKVFEQYIPARWLDKKPMKNLTADLARGESESLQLALIPRTDGKRNLDVSWTPDAKSAAAKLQVRFEQVGYVQSGRRAYAQLLENCTSYPDPLLPLNDGKLQIDSKTQPLWITVRAERNATPGTYGGTITLRENGKTAAQFPLSIKVRSFALPERPQFRTCFFLNRHSMIEFFDLKDWESEKAMSRKLIAKAAENRLTLMPMLEHRPSTVRPLWTATVDKNGDYKFDFTKENELTRMILEEFNGTGYNISPSPTWDQYFGYMWVTDPATGKDKRLNYSLNSPEFEKIYRQFLTAAWENAKKNNWTEYAYHYIWDEWHGKDWNRLHLLSKKFVPELKNLAVGYNRNYMTPETIEAVDIWVPLSDKYNAKFASERVAKSDESWSYVCVSPKNMYNLFVDHEGFSHRALLWWFRDRNLQGLLYWGVSHWELAAKQKKEGKVWPDAEWSANQFPDANGDGYLMYPDAKPERFMARCALRCCATDSKTWITS